MLRLDASELEQRQTSSFQESVAEKLKTMSAQPAELFSEEANTSYKLNPQHPLALRYATKMKIIPGENTKPQSIAKALGIAAIFKHIFI